MKVVGAKPPLPAINAFWSVDPVDANTIDLKSTVLSITQDENDFSPGARVQAGDRPGCTATQPGGSDPPVQAPSASRLPG